MKPHSRLALLAIALMPMPAHLTMGQGELAIDQSFGISVSGTGDARVQDAAQRLLAHIAKRTGMPLSPETRAPKLSIYCSSPGNPVQGLAEDESYKLAITPEKATLTAATPLGVIHGLATFEQLVEPAAANFAVPALTIEDAPRFPWRGLHLDVSRHWMPLDVVKRTLDGMAAVKLNVFHWHLSDNQGFRVESKKYPKLQGLGSDGLFYTQDEVREVIAYARDRGIRVVPEFDIPGHSTSWLAGYPELAAASGHFEIGRTWGIFDPVMDPTSDALYKFLDNFIGEMAKLFPDPYFHIGGDEVNGKEWDGSARITRFKRQHGMLTDASPTPAALRLSDEKLQAYFNEKVLAIVAKHGKKMMGWDEILAPELSRDIVIQSWRGQQSLAEAVQQGFHGILSSGYYLDHMDSAAAHYASDPLIDPKTKQPLKLTPEQQARILGGEVCMWSEYVTPENVDSRIWPRSAAIAERFWTPVAAISPGDLYARLSRISAQLEWYGLTHRSSYGPMLERIAGSTPLEPLETLASVVTPGSLGVRARAGRNYTQRTPLNRLVDAARPESDVARNFSAAVEARDWDAVRAALLKWKTSPPVTAPEELAPLSRNLAQLAAIGLEALDAIASGKAPGAAWTTRANQLLAAAKKPVAEVYLAVASPIQTLVGLAAKP